MVALQATDDFPAGLEDADVPLTMASRFPPTLERVLIQLASRVSAVPAINESADVLIFRPP